MKFIHGIDFPDKKKTIYKQKKYKNIKFKYNIVKKDKYVVLKIYEKEKSEKKETIKKKFKIKNIDMGDYVAEYEAKIYLIKYLRKHVVKK